MSGILRFFLYNMWEKSKGPGNLYVWLFILALMVAYASLFPVLVEIFGTTTRVFPAIYLSIAAVSWGVRGAVPVTILNSALNLALYRHTGHPFEGGFLGPVGCLIATCLIGMISDLVRQLDHQLNQRQAMESVLKESEKRYRGIFNMASDAIFLIDGETGCILEANASASNIYGYNHDEFLQMRGIDLSGQPEETKRAILEQKKHIPLRSHKKKDGLVFPVEVTAEHSRLKGKEVHLIAIRDISARLEAEKEKRRLEAQFYQAQKLESIGTLAGGIAHDFNNLLGGIMGHASLALLKTTPEDSVHEHLAVINRLSKSGGDLTKHILGFARGGKYDAKPTDLNELISHHDLVFGRTHKHINIEENFGDGLWAVEVDRGQIEQVLFNIYINSVHAMPDKGSLFVTTRSTTLQDTSAFPFPVKPGEYVEVSIRDTGSGMDAATRERIFEPFFSTKAKGVGTGLGMAAAYGIVKNHGGYIEVLSEPGSGTTIRLLFPRSEKEYRTARPPQATTLLTGSGTILLVDDEEEILEVEAQMLQVLGYDALTAKGGSRAISMFSEKKDTIDLVVMDMVMPDMSGVEAFSRLKQIDRNVKVLFQTGYSLEQARKMEMSEGSLGVIRKPFTLDALSRKLKGIMDGPRPISMAGP